MDTEAQQIFTQGARFDLSAGYLMQILQQWIYEMHRQSLSNPYDEKKVSEAHKMPPMIIPATVSCSLSIELYLKSLIVGEGKSYKKVHEFDKLFNMLNGSTQKAIREKYNEIMKLPIYAIDPNAINSDTSFDVVLKSTAKSFADWRYIFENTPAKIPADPPSTAMARALRQTILDNDPHCKLIWEVMQKPMH